VGKRLWLPLLLLLLLSLVLQPCESGCAPPPTANYASKHQECKCHEKLLMPPR